MGVANVGGISLQQFDILYPTVQIEEFDLRSASRKFINSDRLIDFGYGSTNEYGAYLQMDVNLTDTIIYVTNTTGFPNSGVLLIGKEMVQYTSKLSDRFLGVTRGSNGSIRSYHTAGDYLRTISNINLPPTIEYPANADFFVITYTFTNGTDLDTRTSVSDPSVGGRVGWGWSTTVGSPTFMTFGGDNTGTGVESVLFDKY